MDLPANFGHMAATAFGSSIDFGQRFALAIGALTADADDDTTFDGDVTMTAGDLLMTAGNLTLTSGNAVLTSGNLTLSAGNLAVTGNITANDDGLLALGTGNTARISWDTTDANANALLIQLPAAGAVDVPVIIIGQSIESVDPARYDGVTEPRIAIYGVGAVATAPIFEFRKARGTFASPTVVTSADDLGSLEFYGCVAAGEYVRASQILAEMTGTIATTRGPGVLKFLTATDAAPSVLTVALTISAAQLVTCAAGLTVGAGATTLAGTSYIGDTANANVTLGLTINQGAADDHVLALKSSDVAHAATGSGGGEADTFGFFGKAEAAAGGLQIVGLKDGDGVAGHALQLRGVLDETAADTTKTAAGIGVVTIDGTLEGTNVPAVCGSDENLLVIRNLTTTRHIFDAEGTYHGDEAATTYDEHDDVSLTRAFDVTSPKKKGVIKNQWDKFAIENEQKLIDLRILGAPRSEGGLVCFTRLVQLHNGAIWQMYSDFMDLVASLPAEMQAKLPERIRNRLPSNLLPAA